MLKHIVRHQNIVHLHSIQLIFVRDISFSSDAFRETFVSLQLEEMNAQFNEEIDIKRTYIGIWYSILSYWVG